MFLRIPFAFLKRGWIPISLFLIFTFISNIFFSHGKVLYSFGTVVITEEGLAVATVRTLRVFFMIAGAKILTLSTPLETLVGALGNTLRPFEKIGLPVSDFFSVMGLTLKCFPRLKDYLAENYKNHKDREDFDGFWIKAGTIASFLLPMFMQSMRSPEMFFPDLSGSKGQEGSE